MIIDFEKMEEAAIKNFYDGHGDTITRMFSDGANRIMHGRLGPGASIGMHRHETGGEIVYILEGEGKALFDDAKEDLKPGICHYCPKEHTHSLINNGNCDLIFFAVVPQQ